MKKFLLFLIFIICGQGLTLKAQLTAVDTAFFESYEDTLNAYTDSLFNSNSEKSRKFASQAIARYLTKVLKRPNSFNYSFPNLQSISIAKSEDEAFRIFTYQLIFDNNTYKYFGAIQLNLIELSLIPLIDMSAILDDGINKITTDPNNWYGALYYAIKKTKSGNKEYYTLFGYDGNNALSTKKIMDVLWFDANNNIKFGAPIFELEDGQIVNRFILEYKKGVSIGSRYSEEEQKIIFDHLITESEGGEGQFFTYVPDGSYSGFEWKKDKWIFIDKLYEQKLKDGEFPFGH